ncbi:MAG TPA: hypothetical protein VFS08_08810 [Gemmatimonadaceae bacterium]|nr:hypothetical protein [Gemmatimonadaceae bacterium]
MAYADRRGGSLKIDVVTASIGRINKATGFHRQSQVTKVLAIVRKLDEDAQVDVLQALKDGEITFHQLVDADRTGRLRGSEVLTTLRLREPLRDAVERTLPGMAHGATQRRYATSLRKLQRVGLPIPGRDTRLTDRARVGDLARADWRALRADPAFRSAADWNHLRRALSAFLTAFLGDVYHPFRRGVVKRIKLRKERPRVPDLSVDLFWRIVAAAPEHARPCYVVLAASGMRLGEYLSLSAASLRPARCAIDIRESKTEAGADLIFVARRLWEWVERGVPSPLGARWMGVYWRRACLAVGAATLVGTGEFRTVRVAKPGPGPYRRGEAPRTERREMTRYEGPRLHDLRHLFSQLADDRGATTEMVMAALRHTNPRQTSDYKRRRAKGEVAELVGAALLEPPRGEPGQDEPRRDEPPGDEG